MKRTGLNESQVDDLLKNTGLSPDELSELLKTKNLDDIIKGSGEELLNGSGKFIDDSLEDNYQKYVARKTRRGKTPRERLDWKEVSEYYKKDSQIALGNQFNQVAKDADIYPYHEVHLSNGKRLDSYIAGKDIVSRKATSLDNITEGTYRKYLLKFSQKYSVGTEIRSNKYQILDGLKLKGQYVLEIPAINADLPNIQHLKDIAEEYDVILRFLEGLK